MHPMFKDLYLTPEPASDDDRRRRAARRTRTRKIMTNTVRRPPRPFEIPA